MKPALLAAIGSGRRIGPPALVPRTPLGPFPQPQNYELPTLEPYARDLYTYRGNFCGLRMPGAPWPIPGGNDANSTCIMACLLDNYPRAFQDRYLQAYAEAGYTHLQRSIGHSIYYGHSVADHIELSRRAQRLGLWCDEWLMGGGEGDSWPFKLRDQTVAYWKPLLNPYIGQLLDAGVIDHACVGWQLDQFNIPGNALIEIIQYVAQRLPRSIPLYTHWVNEALAWWKTGGEIWQDEYQMINVQDRFTWWQAMNPYLTGGHHQGDTHMARTDLKLYQDKMRDTAEPFANGRMGVSLRTGTARALQLVAFESTAQEQFDGSCPEIEGDMIGYVLSAITNGNYGNGGRRLDGTAL